MKLFDSQEFTEKTKRMAGNEKHSKCYATHHTKIPGTNN